MQINFEVLLNDQLTLNYINLVCLNKIEFLLPKSKQHFNWYHVSCILHKIQPLF